MKTLLQMILISVGFGLAVRYDTVFLLRTIGLIVIVLTLDWRYL